MYFILYSLNLLALCHVVPFCITAMHSREKNLKANMINIFIYVETFQLFNMYYAGQQYMLY